MNKFTMEIGTSGNMSGVRADLEKFNKQLKNNKMSIPFAVDVDMAKVSAKAIKDVKKMATDLEKTLKGTNLELTLGESTSIVKGQIRETTADIKKFNDYQGKLSKQRIADLIKENEATNKLNSKNGSTKDKNANMLLQEQIKQLDKITKLRSDIISQKGNGQDNLASVTSEKLKNENQYYKVLGTEIGKYSDIISQEERRSILKNKSLETELDINATLAKQKDISNKNAQKESLTSVSKEAAEKRKMYLDEEEAYAENARLNKKQESDSTTSTKKLVSEKRKMYLDEQDAHLDNVKYTEAETSAKRKIYLDTQDAYAQNTAFIKKQEAEIASTKKKVTAKVTDKTNLDTGKIQLDNRLSSYLRDNTKLSSRLRNELLQMKTDLKSVDKVGLGNLKNKFSEVTSEAKALGQTGDTAFTKLGKNIYNFSQFLSAATISMAALNTIRGTISTVVELDKSFVDLQMATGKSNEETKMLLNTYIKMGQELGATGVEVANAGSSWLKQGKSIEETNKLIKDSIVLSKIGSIESADATKYLTTITKAYGISVDDTLSVVDKLSKVDLSSATDVGGLSIALNEVSSNANSLGVNIDELLGYVASIGEVSGEEMSAVGNGLNTMFSRMGNIKLKRLVDPTTGEDLSNTETSLKRVGIALRDDNETFRDFSDVLSEVAGNWSGYNDVTKQSIAASIAGVDHINQFKILMGAFGKATEYTTASLDSSGTAMEKFSAYEGGVESKTKKLTASLQEVASTTLKSSSLDFFVGLATNIVKATNAMGGLVPVVLTLGGAFLAFKFVLPLLVKDMSALLLTETGVTATTLTQIVAQTGLNGAFALGTASVKSFSTALLASPLAPLIAVILVASIAISGMALAFDKINVSAKEQTEITAKLSSEYEELKTRLSSVNDELKTTQDRMAELNGKDSLTLVEQDELENLKETNKELENKIKLIEKEKDIKNEELSSSTKKEYDKKYGVADSSSPIANVVKQTQMKILKIEGETEDDYVDYQIDKLDELNKKKEKGKELTKEEKEQYKELTKYLNNVGIDFQGYADKYSIDDDTRKNWIDMIELINQATNPDKANQKSFDDIFNAVPFAKAKAELEGFAKAGTLDEDMIKSNDEYMKLVEATGYSASQVAEGITALMIDTTSAIDTTAIALVPLNDMLTKMTPNVKSVAEAQAELAKSGFISYDTASSLLAIYPQLENALTSTAGGFTVAKGALDTLTQSELDSYQTTYDNAITTAQTIAGAELTAAYAYDGTTESIKRLITAKMALLQVTADEKAAEYTELGIGGGGIDTYTPYTNVEAQIKKAQEALDNVNTSATNLEKAKKLLKNLKSEKLEIANGSGSGSGGSAKTKFSEQMDLAAESIRILENQLSSLENKIKNDTSLSAKTKDTEALIAVELSLQKAYSKTASLYSSKYKSSLSKLSKDDKKKVTDGSYTIENFKGTKGEARSNNIKDAIKYRDDLAKEKELISSTTQAIKDKSKELANLRTEESATTVDKINSEIDLMQSKLDNTSGLDAQNSLLDQMLTKYQDINNEAKQLVTDNQNDMKDSFGDIKSKNQVNGKGEQVSAGTKVSTKGISKTSQEYADIIAYNALVDAYTESVSAAEVAEEQWKKQQIETSNEKYQNSQTELDNRIGLNSNDSQDIQNAIDEATAKGQDATEGQYQGLIQLAETDKKYYEQKKKLAQDAANEELSKNGMSDRYKELTDDVQEAENAISDCNTTQSELNKSILELPLSTLEDEKEVINETISALERKNDILQKQLDLQNELAEKIDTGVNSIVSALEDEIAKEEEKVSLAKDANDEAERAINLTKLKQNLDKAMNNKTQQIIHADGSVSYQADASAIADAQDAYSTEQDSQKEIADDKVLSAHTQAMKDYVKAIQEGSTKYQDEQDSKTTSEIFGDGWLTRALGLDPTLIKDVTDKSYNSSSNIASTEGLIKANDKLIEDGNKSLVAIDSKITNINKLVESFQKGEISFDQATGKINVVATTQESTLSQYGSSNQRASSGIVTNTDTSTPTSTLPFTTTQSIFSEEQINKLWAMSNTQPISTPNFSSMNSPNVTNNNQTVSLNIGDIYVSGIQDVNGLSTKIVSQLPNAILNQIYKRT